MIAVLIAITATTSPAIAADLRLAVTTSLESSGLLRPLLRAFEAEYDIDVQAIVAGSGTALRYAENGDVDAVIAHSREDELRLVASGALVKRTEFMFNRFLIVGPRDDPAGIAAIDDGVAALRQISQAETLFISRGDTSGTHRREQALWREAGINPRNQHGFYRETGSGMGATLNIAAELSAYTLSDEGSWSHFANRRDLVALLVSDRRFLNPYAVSLSAAAINRDAAEAFCHWLLSERGGAVIAAYRADDQQVFFPFDNALSPHDQQP